MQKLLIRLVDLKLPAIWVWGQQVGNLQAGQLAAQEVAARSSALHPVPGRRGEWPHHAVVGAGQHGMVWTCTPAVTCARWQIWSGGSPPVGLIGAQGAGVRTERKAQRITLKRSRKMSLGHTVAQGMSIEPQRNREEPVTQT